ncbi:MAG: prolyl oligopeptidase family serine peptidase [Candidatus Aminicenantes bacterium]|nr:prolyl oligopeptidase family serine peptidase [Candidatus Aminicenantes bacterium]
MKIFLHQISSNCRSFTKRICTALVILSAIWILYQLCSAEQRKPIKQLPLPGQVFEIDGHTAFVILPAIENRYSNRPIPWVWYAPTLNNLPDKNERWMFERFLAAGIAIAGIDVGESYGSPQGRAGFSALYRELVERRGFSRKPCLLARSRGGLMLYNWAVEHPDSVSCIAGIYPACNLRSYPGLDKACTAYGMSAEQLGKELANHNPIDRLASLARAKIPIFHIHGEKDELVPLSDNSALLASRYRELGGSMRLRIVPGQGHNLWKGFFQCQELVEFIIEHAIPLSEREPNAELFKEPPLKARPGALWSWMNGYVNLERITYELEEMKAKGMSGAEIWDIGVYRPNPEEPIPAGPAFLSSESLKAINHAINEADRLGLHLGIVASSSWNAGGSWVQPREAMKGLYVSEINVSGPAKLSQVLPFPTCNAPKDANGLPLYYKEIAVLAFPQTPDNTIRDVSEIINLSDKMDGDGRLVWDVPPGSWVIARFITSNTGEKLMVPSPNSDGLLIDHLDGNAIRTHFQYIINQILKIRPSLDALHYMELDSVEVDNQTDWTDSFVDEFRKRRGYDPIPYLPILKGKKFADPQINTRFKHDYNKTVSELWIEGHYGSGTEFLNRYGMQLVAEAGHGGYPRAEPLRACGVVDVPRGEFWNGSRFWIVKEAASAAHIYGRQIVDAESFTGWRHWQDGPLEYKRLADTAFCAGLNRITFHTFAHTPPEGGLPGHIYHAGEHFNVNTTWWQKSAPMLSYFSRCCYLLQLGLPVADVCFYYGDDAPNVVATRCIGPDSKRLDFGSTCAHCGRPNPAPVDVLGLGYDYDVVNSDVIINMMEFRDGRLVLPHGVSYSIIVLPERSDIPLPVLKKLEKLVWEGAILLGPKPLRDVTLADYPNCDKRVQAIAERMWGPGKVEKTADRRYGKGRIIADRKRVREILQQLGIGPDFTYTSLGNKAELDYIHRRTPNADIYFIRNAKMEEAEADCTFRVPKRLPQFWYPDTGKIEPCNHYTYVAGGTKLRLRLPPAGSVFVVFSGVGPEVAPSPAPEPIVRTVASLEITGPWEVRFPPNLGAPSSYVFEKLVSWTEVQDERIKYFSGTATYVKEFEVPASMVVDSHRLELDLGKVRNVADVTLNGIPLGIAWKPPYSYDVTGLIRIGKNELKVEIVNLWANRLVGDAKLPREKRVTRLTQKVNVKGPLESGLLGPVQLRLLEKTN